MSGAYFSSAQGAAALAPLLEITLQPLLYACTVERVGARRWLRKSFTFLEFLHADGARLFAAVVRHILQRANDALQCLRALQHQNISKLVPRQMPAIFQFTS